MRDIMDFPCIVKPETESDSACMYINITSDALKIEPYCINDHFTCL